MSSKMFFSLNGQDTLEAACILHRLYQGCWQDWERRSEQLVDASKEQKVDEIYNIAEQYMLRIVQYKDFLSKKGFTLHSTQQELRCV